MVDSSPLERDGRGKWKPVVIPDGEARSDEFAFDVAGRRMVLRAHRGILSVVETDTGAYIAVDPLQTEPVTAEFQVIARFPS